MFRPTSVPEQPRLFRITTVIYKADWYAQLLKALRDTIIPQPKDILGFEQIDRLLELFRFHQPASPARRPGWSLTEDDGTELEVDGATHKPRPASRSHLKSRPPVINITSSSSASGSSSLLYHLTALSLLPTSSGCKASSVTWLDTDGRFSALRLSHFITAVANQHDPQLSPHDNETLVSSALAHLRVVKPTSSASLLASLEQLPNYLLAPTNISQQRCLGLIVLDSATAFQHQDRLSTELARLSNPSVNPPLPPQPSHTSSIITSLKALQSQFNCTILFTTKPLHPTRSKPKPPTLPSGIASEAEGINPWTAFATLTLHLTRLPVPQFAPSMTLDECLRGREKRQDAVGKGRVRVGVDVDGSEAEHWPIGVREKVVGMDGKGGFIVRVGKEGIEVE